PCNRRRKYFRRRIPTFTQGSGKSSFIQRESQLDGKRGTTTDILGMLYCGRTVSRRFMLIEATEFYGYGTTTCNSRERLLCATSYSRTFFHVRHSNKNGASHPRAGVLRYANSQSTYPQYGLRSVSRPN